MKIYLFVFLTSLLTQITLFAGDRVRCLKIAEPKYTPSKWQIIGEKDVIAALKELGPSLSSKNLSKLESPTIHEAIEYLKKVDRAPHQETTIIQESGNFYVTYRDLGIRAINRLTDANLSPMGLMKAPKKVDGKKYGITEFFEHDFEHAMLLKTLRDLSFELVDRSGRSLADFHKSFSYQEAVTKMSETERMYFDMGYFLSFHENYMVNFVTSLSVMLRVSDGVMTKGTIQRAMKQNNLFGLEFSGERVSSDLIGGAAMNPLVNRFLSRGDLFLNLPVELQAKISQIHKPIEKAEVVKSFIESSLESFFQNYYDKMIRFYDAN